MFDLVFDLKTNIGLLKKMTRSGIHKLGNEAWDEVMREEWVTRYVHLHFDRVAYRRYQGVHTKVKSVGFPMKETGHFEAHILGQQLVTRGKLFGASGWRGIYRMGRPAELSTDALDARARALARRRRIPFQAARNIIYSNAGYGSVIRQRFENELMTVNRAEESYLKKLTIKRMVKKLKENPRYKRKRYGKRR